MGNCYYARNSYKDSPTADRKGFPWPALKMPGSRLKPKQKPTIKPKETLYLFIFATVQAICKSTTIWMLICILIAGMALVASLVVLNRVESLRKPLKRTGMEIAAPRKPRRRCTHLQTIHSPCFYHRSILLHIIDSWNIVTKLWKIMGCMNMLAYTI